jgi:signal peptide peptidase SppA
MNYQFAKMLDGTSWAMRPRSFKKMLQRAMAATPEDVRAAVAAYGQQPPVPRMYGDVAVIDACGPITYESSWFSMYFGGSSIKDMQAKLQAALADPAVKTIVFRWDSPGGCCEMVPEFADELFAARGSKPILAVADTMIASAAYWIGSQSDVIYATTSARIGAIGVFTEHDDISGMLEKAGIKITLIAHGAHKVDGNPYEPLPDDVKAEIKEDVDAVGDLFDNAVARGRGVTKKTVLDSFGQGDVFSGKEAIALGLADKGGTFAQLITRLTKGRSGSVSIAAKSSEVEPTLQRAAAESASRVAALLGKAKKADDEPADTMEPVDGECEDGYELGDDGVCHLIVPDDDEEEARAREAKEKAQADADHVAIAAVLGAER